MVTRPAAFTFAYAIVVHGPFPQPSELQQRVPMK